MSGNSTLQLGCIKQVEICALPVFSSCGGRKRIVKRAGPAPAARTGAGFAASLLGAGGSAYAICESQCSDRIFYVNEEKSVLENEKNACIEVLPPQAGEREVQRCCWHSHRPPRRGPLLSGGGRDESPKSSPLGACSQHHSLPLQQLRAGAPQRRQRTQRVSVQATGSRDRAHSEAEVGLPPGPPATAFLVLLVQDCLDSRLVRRPVGGAL